MADAAEKEDTAEGRTSVIPDTRVAPRVHPLFSKSRGAGMMAHAAAAASNKAKPKSKKKAVVVKKEAGTSEPKAKPAPRAGGKAKARSKSKKKSAAAADEDEDWSADGEKFQMVSNVKDAEERLEEDKRVLADINKTKKITGSRLLNHAGGDTLKLSPTQDVFYIRMECIASVHLVVFWLCCLNRLFRFSVRYFGQRWPTVAYAVCLFGCAVIRLRKGKHDRYRRGT